MAGPNNQYKFRKEMLNKNSRNSYQDPTYLSFTIVFDPTSPLFNPDIAYNQLLNFYGEKERAAKLEKFIKTLFTLNSQMPWYWKSIEGIDRAITYNENRMDAYAGGDDAKIAITCNETINLAISGLMDLYRESLWDNLAWTQVLPKNMRQFRMWIYVSEIRKFSNLHPGSMDIVDMQAIDGDITEYTPIMTYEFDFCEFQMNSASEALATLNSNAPEMTDNLKLNIKYEKISRKDSDFHYLQGFTDTPSPTKIESVNNQNTESRGDRLSRDLGSAIQRNAESLSRNISRMNPARLINNSENVYGSPLDRFLNTGVNSFDNLLGGLGRIPDNIYKDSIVNAQDSATAFRQALTTNIFGVAGKPVGEALKQGAIASIFPLINNQEGFRGDLGNING